LLRPAHHSQQFTTFAKEISFRPIVLLLKAPMLLRCDAQIARKNRVQEASIAAVNMIVGITHHCAKPNIAPPV
jgi:hypothetical protein